MLPPVLLLAVVVVVLLLVLLLMPVLILVLVSELEPVAGDAMAAAFGFGGGGRVAPGLRGGVALFPDGTFGAFGGGGVRVAGGLLPVVVEGVACPLIDFGAGGGVRDRDREGGATARPATLFDDDDDDDDDVRTIRPE